MHPLTHHAGAGTPVVHRMFGHVPAVVPVAIAGAWVLAVVAQLSGRAAALHHDALLHSRLPTWAALGVFLLAWQVMIAAMMLPTAIPMLWLFGQASAARQRRGALLGVFAGAYALVWSMFGAVAFLAGWTSRRSAASANGCSCKGRSPRLGLATGR